MGFQKETAAAFFGWGFIFLLAAISYQIFLLLIKFVAWFGFGNLLIAASCVCFILSSIWALREKKN